MQADDKISLGRMVGMTMKAMKDTLTRNFELANCPISAEQFITLKIITFHEDISQQDCADLLRMDKSLFLRKIDVLQKLNLLVRIPNKTDKRKNQLVITKKGMEMLKKCEEVEQNTMRNLTKGVSENDFKIFSKVLTTIRENAFKDKN